MAKFERMARLSGQDTQELFEGIIIAFERSGQLPEHDGQTRMERF